jgi:cytochrome b561
MLRNTETTWGSVARFFHWALGFAIIALFAYGLWMKGLPTREDRVYHYAIHASVGISVLVLMVLRVVWRLVNPTPKPPPGATALEIKASRFGHLAIYLGVFATLVAGWLLAGSGKATLDYHLFGLVPMPNMLGTNSPYHGFFEEAHELAAYALMALVAGHVAAAIWHQRIKRDGLLARMMSGKPSA